MTEQDAILSLPEPPIEWRDGKVQPLPYDDTYTCLLNGDSWAESNIHLLVRMKPKPPTRWQFLRVSLWILWELRPPYIIASTLLGIATAVLIGLLLWGLV